MLLVVAALTPRVADAACTPWFTVGDRAGGDRRAGVLPVAPASTSTARRRSSAAPSRFDDFALFVTITICAGDRRSWRCSPTDYLRREELDGPEVYALFLLAAIGGVVMASANDLIVLFLGLEIAVDRPLRARRQQPPPARVARRAGIKYFVLGGFSSAFFLYGIALRLRRAPASTNFTTIVDLVQRHRAARAQRRARCSPASRCCSSASASRSPPCRSTSGRPTCTRARRRRSPAFMASVGKAAAFAALLRVLVVALPHCRDDWRPVIWVLAVLTLRRRLGAGRRADQREADAGLLVDQPRRVHPRRRRGRGAPGRPASTPARACRRRSLYLLPTPCWSPAPSPSSPSSPARGDGRPTSTSFRGLGRQRPALALALTVLPARPGRRAAHERASSPSSA